MIRVLYAGDGSIRLETEVKGEGSEGAKDEPLTEKPSLLAISRAPSRRSQYKTRTIRAEEIRVTLTGWF